MIPSGGTTLINHAYATVKACMRLLAPKHLCVACVFSTALRSALEREPSLHAETLPLHPLMPNSRYLFGSTKCSPVSCSEAGCDAVPAHAHTQVLRETLRCRLPIEVIYNGKYEMDAPACAHFEVGPTLLHASVPCITPIRI